MPRFDSSLSPVIIITKSQLLKLAFDPHYKSIFLDWIHDQTQLASDKISSDLHLDKIHLDLHVSKPEYADDHSRTLMKSIRLPKLLFLLSCKYCLENKISLPDSLKVSVPPYDGLRDLFFHSSNSTYVKVIDEIIVWLHGMLRSDSYYDKRLPGLLTVIDDLINHTTKILSTQQNELLPNIQNPTPNLINSSTPTPTVVQIVASDLKQSDHLSQGRSFLEELKKSRFENINTKNISFTDIDFSKNFEIYFTATTEAIKTDLMDHVNMIDGFTEKQDRVEEQANQMFSLVEKLSQTVRYDIRKPISILSAVSALDQAFRTFHQVLSSLAASETLSALNNSLLNTHQFQVFKTIQMLPGISDDISKSLLNVDEFNKVRMDLMISLYKLGNALEGARDDFKNMAWAREYVADLISNKQTMIKNNKKLEASAAPLEYPFEPRIKQVIDRIRGREKSLKNKQQLHLEWSKKSFADAPASKALTDNNQVTAISSLFGLDEKDINQLQAAESLNKKNAANINRSNALLTLSCDQLLRKVSTLFYVTNSYDNQSYFIDFQLYDQDIPLANRSISSLPVKNSIDRNYLRYIKAQYDTVSQSRRTESVKLATFKVIYQTYYLPFEFFDIDADTRIFIRKDLHRLKPNADKLFAADSRSFRDDKTTSLMSRAYQIVSADSDIVDLRRYYVDLDTDFKDILLQVIGVCQAIFMHNISFWSSLLLIDQNISSLVPSNLWRHSFTMFQFINVHTFIESYPLQAISDVCDSVFPGWWTRDLRYNHIRNVMTDDKFCKYKGTLEKFKDDVTRLFTGGDYREGDSVSPLPVCVGQRGGATISPLRLSENTIKRSIVHKGLGIIELALKSSLGNVLSNNLALNDARLLEKVVLYLRHMIEKEAMSYDEIKTIVRNILGTPHRRKGSGILVEPYVRHIASKLFDDYWQSLPPPFTYEKAKKFAEAKKTFAPVLINIAKSYNPPSTLLDGVLQTISPPNSLYI